MLTMTVDVFNSNQHVLVDLIGTWSLEIGALCA
jgi:hypothetical protein